MEHVLDNDALEGKVILADNRISHQFSLIVCRTPWVVVPIEQPTEDDYIDLTRTHEWVLNHLRDEHYHDSLREWTKGQPGGDTFDYEECTFNICFNVAQYIASLWTEENFIAETNYLVLQQLALLEGVFLIQFDNEMESHAVVLWFDGEMIRLCSGYGGHKRIIYHEFDRKWWCSMVTKKKLKKEQMYELFDLPREIAEPIYQEMKYVTLEPVVRCQRIA